MPDRRGLPSGGSRPAARSRCDRRPIPTIRTATGHGRAALRRACRSRKSSRRIRASEDLLSMSAPVVDRRRGAGRTGVSAAWGGGWQPSELARHLRLRVLPPPRAAWVGRRSLITPGAARPTRCAMGSPGPGLELDGVRARGWIRRWSDEERIDQTPPSTPSSTSSASLVALPHRTAATSTGFGRRPGPLGSHRWNRTGTSPSKAPNWTRCWKIRNLLARPSRPPSKPRRRRSPPRPGADDPPCRDGFERCTPATTPTASWRPSPSAS